MVHVGLNSGSIRVFGAGASQIVTVSWVFWVHVAVVRESFYVERFYDVIRFAAVIPRPTLLVKLYAALTLGILAHQNPQKTVWVILTGKKTVLMTHLFASRRFADVRENAFT